VIVLNYTRVQSKEELADVKRKQRSVLWNVSLSRRYEMFIGDAANHV
jgi:hypothetical protein